MNENIRSTGNDWEIEHTDKQQELYAHEQGKRLVKLSEIHGRERFYIDGQVGTFWNGGPVMTEGENPEPGYVCVSEDRKNNVWYPSGTIVRLVEELVPDAIVDTVVSDLSVSGDLLQEQIQKIRDRNVPDVADVIIGELIRNSRSMTITENLTPEQLQEKYPDEYVKWAEQQLQNTPIDQKELQKGFTDMLLHNREMYHITEDKMEHIPYTPEKWDEVHSKHSTDDIQTSVSDTYSTLDQILNDLVAAYAKVGDIEQVIRKLDRTLEKGMYLQKGEL